MNYRKRLKKFLNKDIIFMMTDRMDSLENMIQKEISIAYTNLNNQITDSNNQINDLRNEISKMKKSIRRKKGKYK